MHVMVDLETLGTDVVTAPIIQIGAVAFRLEDDGPAVDRPGVPWLRLHVNAASNLRPPFNRVINPDTVAWWAETDPDLLVEIMRGEERMDLREALGEIGLWLVKMGDGLRGRTPLEGVWGNGATFDISMLEMAFGQAGLRAPWSFRNIRDVRTMAMIAGDDERCWKGGTVTGIEATGKKHDAVVDCLRQVRMVQQTWKHRVVANVDA